MIYKFVSLYRMVFISLFFMFHFFMCVYLVYDFNTNKYKVGQNTAPFHCNFVYAGIHFSYFLAHMLHCTKFTTGRTVPNMVCVTTLPCKNLITDMSRKRRYEIRRKLLAYMYIYYNALPLRKIFNFDPIPVSKWNNANYSTWLKCRPQSPHHIKFVAVKPSTAITHCL